MKKVIFFVALLTPFLSHAANLQNLLKNTILFISNYVIPFLFGTAFLLFVINVIRFFIIEGSNENGRENAKNLALYSVAAFVFLILFWGIVRLLVETSGITPGGNQPCPDYIKKYDASKCP